MWKVFHEFILVVFCPFISCVDLKYVYMTCVLVITSQVQEVAVVSCQACAALCGDWGGVGHGAAVQPAALVELLFSELKFCLGSFDEYVQTIT